NPDTTRAAQSAITPTSVPYSRRRRKRRREQPVALGIISLPLGSGKGDEASVSGFAPFGERMAFLSRALTRVVLAAPSGPDSPNTSLRRSSESRHRGRGAPSACGLLLRPRGTVVGMSSGDFREDRRPVWDGHAKARAS